MDDIFVGTGEMAALMRAHDWAATPLGPPAAWPNALKVAVRLLLTSRFEMWLGWGPDIAFFYNDAYRPTLGNKHPNALAVPTRILWAEIWPDVEPRLRAVYERGEATWDRALLLVLNRHGYPEETYHTFSYSPLLGDGGRVEGVFCAVSEETDRVISERRLECLRLQASRLALAESRAAVLSAARHELAASRLDLPFSLTYLFDGEGNARLAVATGFERDHPCAPERIGPDDTAWHLGRLWRGEIGEWVGAAPEGPLPTGGWDRPPSQCVVLPLLGPGRDRPVGALVVGLNPLRPSDDAYFGWIRLVGGQLVSSLASAEAYEAERQRAEALAAAVRMRQEAATALELANERLTSEVRQRTEERDRLNRLFQQAPSFMCLLQGPDHVFTLVNEAYYQLVGHRDLVGLDIKSALPELAGQGYFELLDKVYRTGEPFVGRNMAVDIQRERGGALEHRYVHLVYQPVLDRDGTTTGIFVDGFDVTHQQHAEAELQRLNETLEQRVVQRTVELAETLARLQRESAEREAAEAALRQAQRMESLGALTGGVAHDFNNLLQVINGNLNLLAKDVAGMPVAERRVGNALAGVSRGARLASQLLAFGRRQPLEPKVVNIGRFLKNFDDMLRRALGEEIEVETVVSGGLWNTLVDPGQIENALLNLAINARDAMDGRGRLTMEAGNALLDEGYVRQHKDVAPGQYVMMAVTDTGCGIPPELLERVFEPFFSTKPEGKGTGLGLSMVYGFVKQSGGHIKLYSEVGQGTTIRLYLPRVQQEEDVLADPLAHPVRGGEETVLVVEDDEQVRDTAVATLTDLGYRVLKASNATSALSVIDSGVPIDVLFTDVVMPGPLRSPELARKARERLPDVAVLFTSGYTENAIVHGGRLDPGVELLSKPYSSDALARKIRHVLANREQRRMARQAPVVAPRALTVLLVEDDEFIRGNLAEVLAAQSHVVIQAGDAPAALGVLASARVDVLVADLGLPGISGAELARRARADHPALGVVFATGDRLAARQAGVARAVVLVKPFQPEELGFALSRALVPG
jgi:signal transduction histidine kinase/DNA-binding response OmpR family regulator